MGAISPGRLEATTGRRGAAPSCRRLPPG